MSKKAVISNLYKSIAILFIIVLILILTYSTTGLYPNCDCILDDYKTEKAYILSQLKHSNEKIWIDDEEPSARDKEKFTFLIGISNQLNRNLNLQIDIKEVYQDNEAGIIKSGVFEYDNKPFILESKEIKLVPIEYHNNDFIGTAEFTIYARNTDFPYGDPNHNYAAINFILDVK